MPPAPTAKLRLASTHILVKRDPAGDRSGVHAPCPLRNELLQRVSAWPLLNLTQYRLESGSDWIISSTLTLLQPSKAKKVECGSGRMHYPKRADPLGDHSALDSVKFDAFSGELVEPFAFA